MKANAALVGTNCGVVLNSKPSICPDITGIVSPGYAEINDAFGLCHSFQNLLFVIDRLVLDVWENC